MRQVPQPSPSSLAAAAADDDASSVIRAAPGPRHAATASLQPQASDLPSIFDVLENTTDFVAILDHDWRFTFLNRHAAAILGRGRNLIGEPLHKYFMPERGSDAWVKTVDAARKRESAHFVFFASDLGRWFETHVHPIPSGLQIFFRDVTARRAADNALAQGEARLRLALEAAGDGAWDWDIASGKTTMSMKMVNRLGYDDGTFDGIVTDFGPIIHRDDLERVRQALADHLTGRKDSFDCEYRVRAQSRIWCWVSVRGRVIARDETTGRATRLVGITSDISERKAAEEKAVEQANLLSLAQRGAGAGAWSLDLSTKIVTLEPRAVELLGFPATHDGTVRQSEWAGVIHPDDLSLVAASVEGVVEHGNLAAEFRVRGEDGRIRWIQSVGSQAGDADGQGRRIIGLVLDVTGQKAAAHALRDSEERLRLALEATGDGVWEHNVTSNLTTPSRRLLEKLGYKREELPQTIEAYTALMHPDDVEKTLSAFQAHLLGHTQAYAAEYRIRSASGEWLWFFDRGRVVGRDPVTGEPIRVVGTHSDITEKKRSEIELQSMQAELIHLSRLSAMGAMASTLAHELNQPLTSIANFARGLRHVVGVERDGDDILAEALTGMEDSAQRAGEIVRRLRAYVTKGEVDQRPESVADIVREACALALIDAVALGVEYTIVLGDQLLMARADRVQIQQVLVNLIRNGIDAMKECDRRQLLVSARKAGRMIELRVSDTGTGIADAMRDQLFTPFASSKAEGMGVGLSICRAIVETHKGRIWAEDKPGGGASFCFTIPACRPPRRVSS